MPRVPLYAFTALFYLSLGSSIILAEWTEIAHASGGGCLRNILQTAVEEMQTEHLLTSEEVPAIALMIKHEGWSAHALILRAVAEEAHSHGAHNSKEITQFLAHFSALPEVQQKRVAQSVVGRIQELVGAGDQPGAFKVVGVLAKRLGISVEEYRAFVAEWRKIAWATPDEARQVVQLMLGGKSQIFARGVIERRPTLLWNFRRNVMTKGTGESIELNIRPTEIESEIRALPEQTSSSRSEDTSSSNDRSVPEFQKIKNDMEFEAVWKKVPAALKTPPKLTVKSDFRGIFESAVLKLTSNPTEQASILKLLREDAEVKSFDFVQADFSDGPRTFKMGSPSGEQGRESTKETLRIVTLTRSFEMQRTPITQLEWALVMGENPSYFKKYGKKILFNGFEAIVNLNQPVENVSWSDVQRFVQKLNKLDAHYAYRLPTEAEWEFMARGGKESAYPHGDSPSGLHENAWYVHSARGQTAEVAHFKENAYGLYDMHGNVWEWTENFYEANPDRMAVDPKGPASGSGHVLRGGSWAKYPESLRSAQRSAYLPDYRRNDFGFRLVRTPK